MKWLLNLIKLFFTEPIVQVNHPKPKDKETKSYILDHDKELFKGPFRKFKTIVLHHSLTPDQETKDWDAIKKYHINVNGFSDIGYHFGVEKVHGKFMIFQGRPLNRVGAHAGVKGVSNKYNTEGLGILLVGNFDLTEPSKNAYAVLAKIVKKCMIVFDISVDDVIGHRDVYDRLNIPRQKTCPGALFDIEKFKHLL